MSSKGEAQPGEEAFSNAAWPLPDEFYRAQAAKREADAMERGRRLVAALTRLRRLEQHLGIDPASERSGHWRSDVTLDDIEARLQRAEERLKLD